MLAVACVAVSVFDECVDRRDVYKVATIGDAYLVASGLPHATTDHARQVCLLALDVQQAVQSFTVEHLPGRRLHQRIGLHSGTDHIIIIIIIIRKER